jgi:hypothetical protein
LSEEQPTDSRPENNSQEEEDYRADRDGLLELLVRLVEIDEKETAVREEGAAPTDAPPPIQITLNIGGLIVTGTLISRRAFIQDVPLMQSTIGAWEESRSDEEKEAEDPGYDRHFIHMKDARFIFPNSEPVPKNHGMYWRGQLNRVDGWTVGSFQTVRERA